MLPSKTLTNTCTRINRKRNKKTKNRQQFHVQSSQLLVTQKCPLEWQTWRVIFLVSANNLAQLSMNENRKKTKTACNPQIPCRRLKIKLHVRQVKQVNIIILNTGAKHSLQSDTSYYYYLICSVLCMVLFPVFYFHFISKMTYYLLTETQNPINSTQSAVCTYSQTAEIVLIVS